MFDLEMIKAVYSRFPERIAAAKKLIKQENSFTNCIVNGQQEKLFTSTVTGFRNGKAVKILYWDNADFPVVLSSEQDITLKLVEIKTK